MESVEVRSLPDRVYAVEINDGTHALLADEEQDGGGEDAGMAPFELLLGALGSCMAITMRMYARRKAWPLKSVSVVLTHDKALARDCTGCTPEEIAAAGPQGRIDVINTDINVIGELTAEQVARLHEIAQRCPVHRTLEARPKFLSSIRHSTVE